jgi:sacsin
MAMLFLQNLRSIEFIIIDEHGNLDQLAKSTIIVEPGLENGTWKKLVRVNAKDTVCREEEWLLVDFRPPADEGMSKLTVRAGDLSERIMKKNKLRPHVGIAFPIPSDASPMLDDQGQLFTFLRLPLATGFPGHVHAYFALTPSRQNLRNPGDSGVVKGSDD